jgi:hypothetical protein
MSAQPNEHAVGLTGVMDTEIPLSKLSICTDARLESSCASSMAKGKVGACSRVLALSFGSSCRSGAATCQSCHTVGQQEQGTRDATPWHSRLHREELSRLPGLRHAGRAPGVQACHTVCTPGGGLASLWAGRRDGSAHIPEPARPARTRLSHSTTGSPRPTFDPGGPGASSHFRACRRAGTVDAAAKQRRRRRAAGPARPCWAARAARRGRLGPITA